MGRCGSAVYTHDKTINSVLPQIDRRPYPSKWLQTNEGKAGNSSIESYHMVAAACCSMYVSIGTLPASATGTSELLSKFDKVWWPRAAKSVFNLK